ncbi:MAG: hypothetical protein JXB13_13840 [Phycisphaerae bacterium]|nr:hypothetical protein [Phycisphaerae bacterium]
MLEACHAFARELAVRFPEGRRVAAVLPLNAGDHRLTASSDLLAEQVMVALRDASFEVADRQLLQAVLQEQDMAGVFEQGQSPRRLAGADVLVAGRFALATGRVSLQLKAIDVATNQLVHYGSYAAVPDDNLLALLATPPAPAGGGEAPQITRTDTGVGIRATYREAGADSFRLLDRVRQEIRRSLRWYLVDVVGKSAAQADADEVFRSGRETDCAFGQGAVILEMEFEVHP